MKITEVNITPIKPKDGLIGFASIVVDNSIYLGSIAIYARLDGNGYRITYPTKKLGDKQINIYHPITREMGAEIEQAVLQKTKQIFKSERSNDYGRHLYSNNSRA